MSDTGFIRGVPGVAAAVDPNLPRGGLQAASPPRPTVGRTVLYRLSSYDVQRLMFKRTSAGATEYNPTSVGDTVAMVVVKVYEDPSELNGQCLLDGADSLWVTCVKQGAEPGQWRWPERV